MNAIKYGTPETLVDISGEKTSEGVLLTVTNQGPVISEEDQKKIFNPFYQMKTGQKNPYKGWGIGLSLVKGLAESHGGTVKVVSSQSSGTSFIIFLPLDSRPYQNTVR